MPRLIIIIKWKCFLNKYSLRSKMIDLIRKPIRHYLRLLKLYIEKSRSLKIIFRN